MSPGEPAHNGCSLSGDWVQAAHGGRAHLCEGQLYWKRGRMQPLLSAPRVAGCGIARVRIGKRFARSN